MINHIWGNIYIGDDRDASSFKLRKNFNGLLDLRGLHIDLKLDCEAMYQVLHAVSHLSRFHRNGKVLCFCHAGMDRSPFVVALWLHLTQGYNFGVAYDFVKDRRPQTVQHFEWYPTFIPSHSEGSDNST